MSTNFFETVDFQVIYNFSPCWPAQLWTSTATRWILFLGRCQADKVECHFWCAGKEVSNRRACVNSWKEGRDMGKRPGSGIRLHLCEYSYRDVWGGQLDDYETSWTWPRLLHMTIREFGGCRTRHRSAGLPVVQMWALSPIPSKQGKSYEEWDNVRRSKQDCDSNDSITHSMTTWTT